VRVFFRKKLWRSVLGRVPSLVMATIYAACGNHTAAAMTPNMTTKKETTRYVRRVNATE
jgi:hypothetical protein